MKDEMIHEAHQDVELQGGYSGFQVMEMIKGRIFGGLKFSIPGFFGVQKFG